MAAMLLLLLLLLRSRCRRLKCSYTFLSFSGFVTRNLLTMPVKNSDGQLLAVVQVCLFMAMMGRGSSYNVAGFNCCCSSVLCIYYVSVCPQMPFFLCVHFFVKFIPLHHNRHYFKPVFQAVNKIHGSFSSADEDTLFVRLPHASLEPN